MSKNDLITMRNITRDEIEEILDSAAVMKKSPPKNLFQGLVLASCFFEPSTRTRLSFESAMKRLGGEVIGFSDGTGTSVQKGESLHDTMKVMGEYADLIVLRHPLEGSASHAAESTDKPVINAGDGANQHPSQTLLDLFTIKECQGKIDDLRIAFTGDLLYGRTIHSLVQALSLYNVRLYFVTPPGLEIPDSILKELKQKGVLFSFHQNLQEILPKLDILYVSRIQLERMDVKVKVKNATLTPLMLKSVKDNFRILHPLPRVGDIDPEIDLTPFAYYFQQSANGVSVRQALIHRLVRKEVTV